VNVVVEPFDDRSAPDENGDSDYAHAGVTRIAGLDRKPLRAMVAAALSRRELSETTRRHSF